MSWDLLQPFFLLVVVFSFGIMVAFVLFGWLTGVTAQPAAATAGTPSVSKKVPAAQKAAPKVAAKTAAKAPAAKAKAAPEKTAEKTATAKPTAKASSKPKAAEKPATKKAEPKKEPAAKAAALASATANEEAMAKALAALPADATPEQKADAVGTKPSALSAPDGGKADDLKKIKGIGKVNETKLNELGIYHYKQIAAWSQAEVNWVGSYLSFAGRIEREDWIEQAKKLAG